MRSITSLARAWSALLLTIVTLTSYVSASQQQQPFQPVETAKPLVKRQDCIANFYSCADQGAVFNGACCQNGQSCRLDENNNPACCPNGAVCTGVAPSNFVPPIQTAVSWVPNPYFSFAYAATYFPNSGACTQAINQCSANYDACTKQLDGQVGGGSYQVTIVVPGGQGTTITGNAGITYPTESATSICSSLSRAACGNLQPSMCTMTGAAGGGFYIGNGVGAVAARPTLACAVAAVAGVAGLGFV